MKRKIVWLAVSCLMVAALILASCAPAVPEEKPTTPTTPTTPTAPTIPTTPTPTTPGMEMTKNVFGKLVEKPKYGGVFTLLESVDLQRGFDPYRYGSRSARLLGSHCLEGLGIGDWTKGPGGTNEYPFVVPQPPLEYSRGALAESWEISPDGLTITFHLRQGIRWQNKPPVNGRELVASDVKYCFDRRCATGSGFTTRSPYNFGGMESIKEITTPDKYTVVFKCSKFDFSLLPAILTDFAGEIYPPEVIQTYGSIDDWRNLCGTGAFFLTDYVSASSLTFKKNPDYWGMDELFPENRLPYFDEFKILIAPDVSTRLAAMRAGKAELYAYEYLDWRLAGDLQRTNPELQFGLYDPGSGTALFLRHDVKPFDDLRVRKALQMSLDRLAINELVGEGRCEPYVSMLNKGFGPTLYTPFEELPKNVQEILTYNPEKAKQLLAEAGYPNGFKMEIIVDTVTRYLNNAQIAADYLGRIGVQADIQVKETVVKDTLWTTATYRNALAASYGATNAGTSFDYLFGPGKRMQHNDQYGEELFSKAFSTVDATERNKLLKQLNMYTLENVFVIGIVVEPPMYEIAQPWVRGWHGENVLRRHNGGSVFMRTWLDLDMKQAMTGKR